MQESEAKLDDNKVTGMKSFPFIVPQRLPKSGSPSHEVNNDKIRNICCVHCKYQMPTHIFDPICGVCGHEMITVI